MKWIVAGAGALLSIAGLYGLVTGASIIQVERGWASFIAGAVFVSAGVITLAIAAFMARLETLVTAWTSALVTHTDDMPDAEPEALPAVAPADLSADVSAKAPFKAPPMPSILASGVGQMPEPVATRDAPRFSDLPPLRVEPAGAPSPAPSLEPEPMIPAPKLDEPVLEKPVFAEPVIEPAKVERPAALRDFKFVFPPVEDEKPAPKFDEKEPEPVPASVSPAHKDDDRVEPLENAEAKPAARFNLGWLRRNRDEATPAPERIEPEPLIALEPALQAPAEPLFEAPPVFVEETVKRVSVSFEAPREEPLAPLMAAKAAPLAEPVKAPDPFSSDWLERALSGDEEPAASPSQPFMPPSQRRASGEDASPVTPLAHGMEPALEPASASPIEEPAKTETPLEIGRYKANDVSYIMFSDGSITAETANGTFRFNSLIELKDFIERGA